MKNLVFILILNIFLSGCNEKNDELDVNATNWEGVFLDGMTNTNVHDPRYNYTLRINDFNGVEVIAPTEGFDEKVMAIEILNELEMDVTWLINNETQIIRTDYEYNNENELIIDTFVYTEATIPFPNNLTAGKFIKESKIDNQ